MAVYPEDGVAHRLWSFLWRAGERTVLEPESRIQSSFLHEPIVYFALRRTDCQRFGRGLSRDSDPVSSWRFPCQLAGRSQHSHLFLRRQESAHALYAAVAL